MKDYKMIPANRDASVLIREDAKYLMHFRMSKVDYNPSDPSVNSEFVRIVTYTPREFERNEAMMSPGSRIRVDWVRAAGFTKAFLVHDGRLESKEEKVESKPDKDKELEKKIDEIVSAKVTKARKIRAVKDSFQNKAT